MITTPRHFLLYSHLGTDIQDTRDLISIAEFPLESTLKLEEFKDLLEKEQGETETGDREEGKRDGTAIQNGLESPLELSVFQNPH